MEKPSGNKNIKHQEILENLELPEIVLPARQKRLREALLLNAQAEKDKKLIPIRKNNHKAFGRTKTKIWVLAASIVFFLLSYGFYAAFLSTPQAIANITIQVNPVISMTVSEKNNVVEAIGLDEQGKVLLSGLNLEGREIQEALRAITASLGESGFLRTDRRILVALTPVKDNLIDADIAFLEKIVRNTLSGYLIEQNLLLDVKVAALSKELYDLILNIGLMPIYYVDLVDAVGSEMAARVLNLQKELGIDPELFKAEMDSITSLVNDMTEAQISKENIIIALKSAMTADPTLKALSIIIDALMELIEKGLGFKEALDLVQRAIQADPTLESFDELMDSYENEENYETKDKDDVETAEPEEAQDNDSKQIESERPEDEDEPVSADPKPKEPEYSGQPSDEDETGSDETQDDDSQEAEDPEDSGQSSNEDEVGSD